MDTNGTNIYMYIPVDNQIMSTLYISKAIDSTHFCELPGKKKEGENWERLDRN